MPDELSLVGRVQRTLQNNSVMSSYYRYLYQYFNPNITGYTLVFMMPPHLSGLDGNFASNFANQTSVNANVLSTFIDHTQSSQILTFAAHEHTPPQSQVSTAQINQRTGALPYATDVTSTENCNITYVDDMNCSIYLYHLLWVEYIRAIADGAYYDHFGGGWTPIKPGDEYLTPGNSRFMTLDYISSIYTVKYMPDLQTITYIGKSIGCIPTSLPSSELVGNKTSNELAMLNFSYTISAFREYVNTNNMNSWIYAELQALLSAYNITSLNII